MKAYRYLSQSKLRMLEKSSFPIDEGGLTVLGIGFNISSSENSPLDDRVEKIKRQLSKGKQINAVGDTPSNFVQGTGKFVEYLMKEVAIWVMTNDSFTMLLGGSSRYLNFDNFSKENLLGVLPGSNRSAILNSLTSLWRSIPNISRKELENTDPNQVISFWDTFYGSYNGQQVKTESHDDSPYNYDVIKQKSIKDYYEYAVQAYNYSPDYLIDDLEYLSIVYTDYRFEKDFKTNSGVLIKKGTRFIIGSPIYIAQVSPSGNK